MEWNVLWDNMLYMLWLGCWGLGHADDNRIIWSSAFVSFSLSTEEGKMNVVFESMMISKNWCIDVESCSASVFSKFLWNLMN